MAKLFAAVIPNTKCDEKTKWAGDVAHKLFKCEFNYKLKPDDRDTNYYEICFGEETDMAKIALNSIKSGDDGSLNLFRNDPLMMSVYGLYKAVILPDDVTLEQFINGEAG